MLNPHDDPDTARDIALSVIEAEIERLPQPLGEFADRAVDLAERLKSQAINTPRRLS
jgi:hypothetical protein